MSAPRVAVEINDGGVLLAIEGEAPGARRPSPGFALVDGKSLLTGSAAAAAARLDPRRVSSRFWVELDAAPMRRPFPGEITHADLAHTHLERVWREQAPGGGSAAGAVILAVPGAFDEIQLGLILAIARACGMTVRGMVDAALVAATRAPRAGQLLHIDVELHRTVITELEQGEQLRRRRLEVSTRAGLVSLNDAWAKRVAAAFVQRTRFDPLHEARTEQQLYDRMAELLEQLLDAENAPISLGPTAGGQPRVVEVSRAEVAAAVEGAYSAVAELVGLFKRAGEPATLLLSRRAAGLPGLGARMGEIGGLEVVSLPADAAVAAALEHHALIAPPAEPVGDPSTLPFVTSLPLRAAPGEAPRAHAVDRRRVVASVTPAPTHLLHRDIAHRLGSTPLVLGVGEAPGGRFLQLSGATAGVSRRHCSLYARDGAVWVEDHSSYGSFLNGQRIDGSAELGAGDRLRLGSPGIEVRLIRVVDEDGTTRD